MEKSEENLLLGSKTNAQWIKRILVPFWICRILLLVIMGVAQIATVYWISQESDIRGIVLASLVVIVLFVALCVSVDAISLILLMRRSLTPEAFLVLQSIETLLWTGVLAVQIMAAFKSTSRSFLTWFISAIL